MIEILPTKDKNFLLKLNKAYNTEAELAFICIEKKEIKASLLYSIEKDSGVILNVSTVEEDIFDGLVRAVFASLIDLGIDKAKFTKAVNKDLIEKLGFVPKDTVLVNSLKEIIENHKNCKNN